MKLIFDIRNNESSPVDSCDMLLSMCKNKFLSYNMVTKFLTEWKIDIKKLNEGYSPVMHMHSYILRMFHMAKFITFIDIFIQESFKKCRFNLPFQNYIYFKGHNNNKRILVKSFRTSYRIP